MPRITLKDIIKAVGQDYVPVSNASGDLEYMQASTLVKANETLTTLTYNDTNGVLTYTDENGAINNMIVPHANNLFYDAPSEILRLDLNDGTSLTTTIPQYSDPREYGIFTVSPGISWTISSGNNFLAHGYGAVSNNNVIVNSVTINGDPVSQFQYVGSRNNVHVDIVVSVSAAGSISAAGVVYIGISQNDTGNLVGAMVYVVNTGQTMFGFLYNTHAIANPGDVFYVVAGFQAGTGTLTLNAPIDSRVGIKIS